MKSDWLPRALEESRARGFLGPGPVAAQIGHSEGFARCWEARQPAPPPEFLDLGSGGGVPGLVLLQRWGTKGTLVDSVEKRIAFLREVLEWPDAPANGVVEAGRSEDLARRAGLENGFDLVTARSFGPPAVTAECAARFMRVGALLVVSEPPDDTVARRWDIGGLEQLGLESLGAEQQGASFQVLIKVRQTPERFPRRVGVPRKRPLF
jgi:16S rRNA (guanine527-N7)-methyltransferase